MTFAEAAAAGISRLRKPYWNPEAFVELQIVGGCYGAIVKLYDRPGQTASRSATPQSLPSWECGDQESDWEPSPPPPTASGPEAPG